MTASGRFTAEEQLQALQRIAAKLRGRGLEVLALGSAAVALRTGQRGSVTKDLDLHAFPVKDILAFQDAIEGAVEALDGHMQWEADGSSITAHVPIGGREIPVEFVLGREDFIEPEVLEDAVGDAEKREGLLVPSWEHIVAMKAEAWFDRTGQEKRKYLEDLRSIGDWMAEHGQGIRRVEVRRVVEMRPDRKHREMLLTIERIFARVLE